MRKDYFYIAEILRPHGIKGELKIKSHSEDIDNFMQVRQLYIKENSGYYPIAVEGFRLHSGDILIQLQNVYDRSAAERYRGVSLYIAREDASPLAEGEFYISDIIGLPLTDRQGNSLGTLQDVLTSYATNIYQVKTPQGMMLFPAIDSVFSEVNLEKGVIVLNEEILREIATYES